MASLDLADLDQPVASAARALRRAGIAGLGVALPQASVSTDAVAARVGVEPDWITRRTGIFSRRRLAPGATIADLGERAARAALEDADVDAAELDAVLVATASADEVMPAAAPLIAGRLGASAAMAWDVNLACTGFLAGLEQGAALIESGRAATVLVIAADALARLTNHDDRKTAALFGDGAGAVVLTANGRHLLGTSTLIAEPDEDYALVVRHHDRLVEMDGQAVFARAVAGMERCCRTVLAEAGVDVEDVDLVVPHQANARITAALADRLHLDPARVADEIAHVGNTGAATIPLALHAARADGRLPDEGLLLLTAFGAGFAAGALLIELRPTAEEN
ncbi:3-oxoacyl-[acyl-carrier-protein] synthase 3 [Baekduia alba]|uniref:3-oxoacyl-ACP synthase III family protein n=1 Tax=Baekduia alba TaxID=2997333 RepID=UPI00233FD946|nr:beta-ketoacyl-ACP synthase 3 [Baekduia alba]WCB96306.1 3-oxoacyl-[acyl-carrier-protein] synthase 3 [Baekduia alba]